MLVLVSPPGGGKTTVSRALAERDRNVTVSVSATTRDRRPGEEEGVHYYFVTPEKFQQMVDQDAMLEHALVYNKCMYGTPRAPVEAALSGGRDIVFDIDWQGHERLAAIAPDDVVSVFLLPPSWQALSQRLYDRARDSHDDIQKRLAKVEDEIAHYGSFQYVIINNDLDDSIRQVEAILTAERARCRRLTGLDEFVKTLKPA